MILPIATIVDAYAEWSTETPRNKVVLPHVTMYGSTGLMVQRLISALVDRGVEVEPIDLVTLDEGKLALIATLIIGLPISASEIERTNAPDRGLPDHSDTAMAQGMTADATAMSERSAAVSCHKGKRVIGTSPSDV